MEQTAFARLAAINVNDRVEKKNGLSYLSWAWAVDQLMRHDPMATWEYKDPVYFKETLMVFCTVTALGKSMTAQLPVMDHRNKAIPNPDAFAVNTAMQRCLVKAIALHGLGLYIYAGEDLPATDSQDPEPTPAPRHTPTGTPVVDEAREQVLGDTILGIQERMRNDDVVGAFELCQSVYDEEKTFVWKNLSAPIRSAIKKHGESLKETA